MPVPRSNEPELDSPPFRPAALDELAARGYERVNAPRPNDAIAATQTTLTAEEFDRDPKAAYEASKIGVVTVLDSHGRPSMTISTPGPNKLACPTCGTYCDCAATADNEAWDRDARVRDLVSDWLNTTDRPFGFTYDVLVGLVKRALTAERCSDNANIAGLSEVDQSDLRAYSEARQLLESRVGEHIGDAIIRFGQRVARGRCVCRFGEDGKPTDECEPHATMRKELQRLRATRVDYANSDDARLVRAWMLEHRDDISNSGWHKLASIVGDPNLRFSDDNRSDSAKSEGT